MNANHLLIMPININVACTNIIKTDLQTAFCGQILCGSKFFFVNFSLSQMTQKEKKEIKRLSVYRNVDVGS